MQIFCPLSIDAPAELLFCWITQRDRIARWMPNLVDSEVQYDTKGRVGTTLRQVYQGKRRRFEISVKVTAYELNRRLTVQVQTRKQDTTVDYRIHQHGTGSRLVVETRIRFRSIMKVVGFLSGEAIRDRCVRRDRQQLGRLKQLCEQEAGRVGSLS